MADHPPPTGADATWITRLDPEADPRARPDGVLVAVKDNIDLAGVISTAGSLAVAATAAPAEVDAACLDGCRTAGARILGKTNLHELGFGSSGVNPHYGTPANPIDPRRVPGGSSSGSAVAVAREEVTIGFGTDTNRFHPDPGGLAAASPACGPPSGSSPSRGCGPSLRRSTHVGVLARSVADLAAGATLLDPRLTDGELIDSPTIGRFRLAGTDPTIDAAIDSALMAAGIVVDEVELPGLGRRPLGGIDAALR